MELYISGSPEEIATLVIAIQERQIGIDSTDITMPRNDDLLVSKELSLFQQIKALCATHNISISQLERECGLSNATIRRWEKDGKAPSITNVKKVADYFDVSIDYLLGLTPTDHPTGQ